MKKLLLITLLMFAATPLYAATLHFSWTANTDSTKGYKIVMDSCSNVVLDVPGRETTSATYELPAEQEGSTHTFSIFAYNDTQKSDCADFAVWQPPKLGMPMQFIITLQPVNN